MLRHSPFVMLFQSTLSQGERRNEHNPKHNTSSISIHALARRATKDSNSQPNKQDISIHALARRATALLVLTVLLPIHFNPRSRKESDVWIAPVFPCAIHFNPRSRKESDKNTYPRSQPIGYFNPRSRKESDHTD